MSISRSEKLEHGKTRALYACDSVNYFHFDARCTAIERVWLNNCAVLQPAGASNYNDFRDRAKKLKKYKVMLDFKNFNSAHTLRAQEIVIEELFSGLDPEWLDWLVRSINNMYITRIDGVQRWVRGTLMSGHRMTSIIITTLSLIMLSLSVIPRHVTRIITSSLAHKHVCSVMLHHTVSPPVTQR